MHRLMCSRRLTQRTSITSEYIGTYTEQALEFHSVYTLQRLAMHHKQIQISIETC